MPSRQLYRWRLAAERPDPLLPADAEAQISHIVPLLELTGSREQKLRQLDGAIMHLEQLRHRIAGYAPMQTAAEQPGPRATSPAWPWLATGVLLALLPWLVWMAGAWR